MFGLFYAKVVENLVAEIYRLELDKAAQIREKIKNLVTSDSSVLDKAIQSLQTDIQCKKWIDRVGEALQRPLIVEDYRQDEHLREFVMKAIVEQNSAVFSDIFKSLDIKMRALKNRMK